jgi:pimeloyl-ACP methyl ester carboxylesterase
MSKRSGLLVLAMALAGCNPQPDARGPHGTAEGDLQYGALTFAPCSLTPARGNAVEAHCATLAVPENHDEPGGRTIDLAIALVVPDRQAEPDPLVFIAGGPGESALESYPGMHGALGDARSNRIVLLVDARGTGRRSRSRAWPPSAAATRSPTRRTCASTPPATTSATSTWCGRRSASSG